MNKSMIQKLGGTILLGLGMAGLCLADRIVGPEIDAASAMNALTLLTGAVLVIRSRKR